MKSRMFSFRLRPEEIERLEKLSSNYNISPQTFVQRIVRVLVSDKIERQESEEFMRTIGNILAKQSQELEIFSQMIADTSSRLASDIGQGTILFNGKKKKTKQKQTSPKR